MLSAGARLTFVFLVFAGVACFACGSRDPEVPTGRRPWEGPGDAVASAGVVTHERREIAQRVIVPACLIVGADSYRFLQVTPFSGGGATPPGLTDTFYRLDRWRLWTRSGPPAGQGTLFVTIRGSTGIVAEYTRTAPDDPCAN